MKVNKSVCYNMVIYYKNKVIYARDILNNIMLLYYYFNVILYIIYHCYQNLKRKKSFALPFNIYYIN